MRSDSDPRTIKELGFGRWCSEVLFYHYKWHIIGTVGVIAVVLLLLFMNAGVPDNDISVIVAVSEPLDSKVVNELKVEIVIGKSRTLGSCEAVNLDGLL